MGKFGHPCARALVLITACQGGEPRTDTNISALSTDELSITPADQWTDGASNLPAGVINDFTTAYMSSRTLIEVRGADNQGTIVTGIDSTGTSPGDVRIFLDSSISGIDVGTIVFTCQDPRSLAGNRIVCPGDYPYIEPIHGMSMFVRGNDSRWHVFGNNGWSQRAIVQSLQLSPTLTVGQATPMCGQLDNWNPTADCLYGAGQGIAGSNCELRDHTLVRVYVCAGGATITGIQNNGLSNARDWGPVKILMNYGPGPLTLSYLNSASAGANELITPSRRDLHLNTGESVMLVEPYPDPLGSPQWHVVGLASSNESFPSVTTSGALTARSSRLTPSTTLTLPAGLTSDLDAGTSAIARLVAAPNGSIVDGFVPHGPVPQDGQELIVRDVGSGPLVLMPDLLSSSEADHRITLPGNCPITLTTAGAATFSYDDWGRWALTGRPTDAAEVRVVPAVMAATSIADWSPKDASTGFDWQYATTIIAQGSVGTVLRTMEPPTCEHGRWLLKNYGSAYTIKHFAAATAHGKAFYLPGGTDLIVNTGGSVWIWYSDGMWLVEKP
jgi:hypothetical protein